MIAGRRQKKKSRRNADIFSRAFVAVALIFRAAASFCINLATTTPFDLAISMAAYRRLPLC